MTKKETKKYIEQLKTKIEVIDQRIEILTYIQDEMKKSGAVLDVPLGGMTDDLLIINPHNANPILTLLLGLYHTEKTEHENLLTMNN